MYKAENVVVRDLGAGSHNQDNKAFRLKKGRLRRTEGSGPGNNRQQDRGAVWGWQGGGFNDLCNDDKQVQEQDWNIYNDTALKAVKQKGKETRDNLAPSLIKPTKDEEAGEADGNNSSRWLDNNSSHSPLNLKLMELATKICEVSNTGVSSLVHSHEKTLISLITLPINTLMRSQIR
ncbi:hypothetical protein NQZ68_026627 [Dissostichus eleginoides]|nr:hypothetical protein NQZ68_026627 [Dissostichus eleginoides]